MNTAEPAQIKRKYRSILWCAVIFLVVIGLGTSINRTIAIQYGALYLDPFRAMIPPAALKDVEKFDHGFVKHPVLAFLHILPGAVFLLLAPLQFSTKIRSRHIEFHRWIGRLIVTIGLVTGIFGLLLSVPFHFTGWISTSSIVVFGSLFLFALIRALVAIRRRDVTNHREWMIRAFSIAIGISTIRILAVIFGLLKATPTFQLLGITFWVGWTLTFAVAEAWIRQTRKSVLTAETQSHKS